MTHSFRTSRRHSSVASLPPLSVSSPRTSGVFEPRPLYDPSEPNRPAVKTDDLANAPSTSPNAVPIRRKSHSERTATVKKPYKASNSVRRPSLQDQLPKSVSEGTPDLTAFPRGQNGQSGVPHRRRNSEAVRGPFSPRPPESPPDPTKHASDKYFNFVSQAAEGVKRTGSITERISGRNTNRSASVGGSFGNLEHVILQRKKGYGEPPPDFEAEKLKKEWEPFPFWKKMEAVQEERKQFADGSHGQRKPDRPPWNNSFAEPDEDNWSQAGTFAPTEPPTGGSLHEEMADMLAQMRSKGSETARTNSGWATPKVDYNNYKFIKNPKNQKSSFSSSHRRGSMPGDRDAKEMHWFDSGIDQRRSSTFKDFAQKKQEQERAETEEVRKSNEKAKARLHEERARAQEKRAREELEESRRREEKERLRQEEMEKRSRRSIKEYEVRWTQLEASAGSQGTLRIEQIPFPPEGVNVLCIPKGCDDATRKKAFRKWALRWHPDKFMQNYGSRIRDGDKDRVMDMVSRVFQAVNQAR